MAISRLEEISCHQDADMHVHGYELQGTDKINKVLIIWGVSPQDELSAAKVHATT